MAETVSLLNLIIAFALFLLTGIAVLLANNRYRDRRTNERFQAVHNRIDGLNARVDDTRETFVHNDHLDRFVNDLRDGMKSMKEEQGRTNDRLDRMLERMVDAAEKK